MSIDTMPKRTDTERIDSPLLSLPIALKNDHSISVDELLDVFRTSVYAEWMTGQKLRFHRYNGYDREAMLEDLGPDVSPTGHHDTTLAHAIAIIEQERQEGTLLGEIDDAELAVGLFAIGIHDLGECEHKILLDEPGVTRLVGDIPAGCKTNEDREDERSVRLAIYERLYSDVDPAVIARVESIIAHEDHSVLHDLFEAAHRSTTLQTVLNARKALRERYHHPTLDAEGNEKRKAGLKRISVEVAKRSLLEAAKMPWHGHLRELYITTGGYSLPWITK